MGRADKVNSGGLVNGNDAGGTEATQSSLARDNQRKKMKKAKSGGLKVRRPSESNQRPTKELVDKENSSAALMAKPVIEAGKLDIGVDLSVKWLTEPKVEKVASADYWKQVAEERRRALEETLAENEALHDELELLKAENVHLKSLADRAVKLDQLLDDLGYHVVD
ncbi:hypothetical protein HDE_00421 [Halotydeus destructor]|nr:hypothetical protein HDE_00421 [Halotydeus destructor]